MGINLERDSDRERISAVIKRPILRFAGVSVVKQLYYIDFVYFLGMGMHICVSLSSASKVSEGKTCWEKE